MKYADAATVKPAVDDVDFSEVEEKAKNKAAKAGKSAKAGKTEKKSKKVAKPAKEAKTAKPEKAKKEPKVDDDPPPKGLSKWPFKAGSVMRYLFQTLLAGADKKEIQKEVEKSGHNWPLMIGIMRREYAKKKKFTWKFDESGSRFKIHDLKQHNK